MENNNYNKEIEEYRNRYSSLSRSQLIAEMLQFIPDSPQHIATRQLLDEMDTKQSGETLKIAKRTKRWAFWTFILAALSLLVLVEFWIYDHFQPSIPTTKTTETKITKPEPQPLPKAIVPLSKPDNQKSKPQSKTERK